MLFKFIGIVFSSFMISGMLVVGASMINYERFGIMIFVILAIVVSVILCVQYLGEGKDED